MTPSNKELFQKWAAAFAALIVVSSFVPIVYYLIASVGFYVISAFAAWKLAKIYIHCAEKQHVSPNGKAVFITGCDTGFGRITALKLSSMGYHVYAGCLLPQASGAKTLQESSKNITIVPLDVTKDDSVQSAYEFVERDLDGKPLWAIVNNAGIFALMGIEFGRNMDQYLRQMDVNAMGVVRTTRAFLPLVRKNKGARVVIVVSMAGRFSVPVMTPYSMSKYAARAFGEGLRRELKDYGVHVSIIEPVMYKTPLIEENQSLTTLERLWNEVSESRRNDIGKGKYERMLKWSRAFLSSAISKPEQVMNAMTTAVTVENPSYYYQLMSGVERVLYGLVLDHAPEEFQDYFMDLDGMTRSLKLFANR